MPFIHARRTAVFAWKSSTTSSPARSSASACGPSTASIRAARTRKSSAVAISPGYGVAVRSSSFSRTVPGAADGASASVDLPAAILPQSRGAAWPRAARPQSSSAARAFARRAARIASATTAPTVNPAAACAHQ